MEGQLRIPRGDRIKGYKGYVMNCQNHTEVPATAYCRTCGKPICDECRRDAFGTVYCAEHAPAPAPEAPPATVTVPPLVKNTRLRSPGV